ncbi:MAG: 4-alpha-glucanotransferase, partial [Vicinamibacterales bacterium]
MTNSAIQRHYVDALGRRHRPPAATVDVITTAMAGAPSGDDRVVVVRSGSQPAWGPAEIRLEDGTTRTVDRRLPPDLPEGYHRILRRGVAEARLIVAPFACYLPDDYKTWGWAIQLYAARSRKSWGIGDLGDLRRLGRWAKAQGAGIAMINPLASPLPLLPQQASPYFPSSRLFRNPLFLSVEALPGARDLKGYAEWSRQGRALNREPLIDRDAIFTLKAAAFDAVWRTVRRRRDAEFERFVNEQGPVLRQYATFCAFSERFGCGRHGWAGDLKHPGAPGVARLAEEPAIADRIRFHQWLQFQIDRQLARASAVLPVMQDLPIG